MSRSSERRRTFDAVATSYTAARPDYPPRLFEDLVNLTGVRENATLLEIGCGPGNATLPLARQDYDITALELGPRLADQAREYLAEYSNVHVVTTSFEDWHSDTHQLFDLAYAASSWHWVDTSIRWKKAASLIKPGGHLTVFGANHAFPIGYDPIFDEFQHLYEQIREGDVDQWPPPPPRTDDELPVGDYEGSDYFELEFVRRYVWSQTYTTDSYIDLLNTFSDHIAMDEEKRDYLYQGIRSLLATRSDGSLIRHWYSSLAIARRIPNTL